MLKVVTAPAAYPVTLAEAKEWCRVEEDDSSEDGTLTILIRAMTKHAENITGRAFVERTLQLNCDQFQHCLKLPQAPLIGVDSIEYTDLDGAAQTFPSASYEVDTVSEPGMVRPVWGSSWPALGRGFNPVRITYRAGYRPLGSPTDLADNSYLPPEVRMWMAARIATLYEQREQIIIGTIVAPLPRAFADAVLDSITLGERLF